MFLGIDIGTGSTKGVLAQADGRQVAVHVVEHHMDLPRPGWAEFDAERVWWPEVCEISRALTAQVGAENIDGVAISAMGPCLLVTDASGTPLRAAILYGVDTRAREQIAELSEELGAAQIREVAGKDLSSQSVGPKLRWVEQMEPDVFARTRKIFSAHSWVVGKLTGEYVLDHHTASQFDPMYDMRTQSWHPDWAGRIAREIALPRLAWPIAAVGEVSPAASALTGLAPGTPVAAGTVDAWAESFSAGVHRPGTAMAMYASTQFFIAATDRFAAVDGLWATDGVLPGTRSIAGGTATAGSALEWARTLTGSAPVAQLVREAAAVAPGSEGLIALPYLSGERSPHFDADARGVLLGLTLRHTRAHVLRAIYEGIVFSARQILERIEHVQPLNSLVAVGGGTKADLWVQLLSDATGLEQSVPHQTIGASYGDALMAAIATGAVPPETTWASTARVVRPDPAKFEVYNELFAIFTDLYPTTAASMHALAEFGRRE